MERLTKKNYADDCFALENKRNQLPEYKNNHYTQSQYYVDLWHKVKAIEDAEEELGVDLITLLTALNNGFYVKNYGDFTYCKLNINENDLVVDFKYKRFTDNYANEYRFKDYGKTWFLDKKGLNK